MTKRVRQHQLEDLSRSKFSLAVPRNWVCRDKNKDYGIDVEVEIFDDNDRATGLVFWGQLKATESIAESVIKNIYLSIESVKYYKNLDIPVLIVRYSETLDRFYCRWAHEIDLFYRKKKSNNIRISFCEEDIWNDETPNKVKEYLEKIRFIKNGGIKFPIPVYIDIKDDAVNGIPKGVFAPAYRAALGEYPEFAIFQNDRKAALLEATLNGDELVISLSSVSGCTFHSIKARDHEGLAEGIAADTLIGMAIALTRVGQSEAAAKIVLDKRLKSRFIQKRDVLVNLTPCLLRTTQFGTIIDTIGDVIAAEKEDNILEFVTISSTLLEANPDNEERSVKIEEFLKKCLEKYLALGRGPLIGAFYYNLGNHYRSRRLFQKSIRHYLKARRYHKVYMSQAYYLEELGGSLFGYEKHHFSAMLYKMALDKGASSSVKPLFADALMFSGKYQQALDIFSEYLSSKTVEHDEWHLKRLCLDEIIERTGIKEQTRQKEKALAAIDITKAGEDGFLKSLESAIEMDMLCGLAWFNLGVAHNKAGNHEDATFSFAICGLVQTWDIAAWVNATLSSLNWANAALRSLKRGNTTLSSLNEKVFMQVAFFILRTGYFFNGDLFLSNLYEKMNNGRNSEILAIYSNIIEQVLPNRRHRKEKPVIRLMGEDGIFKDIFEGKEA